MTRQQKAVPSQFYYICLCIKLEDYFFFSPNPKPVTNWMSCKDFKLPKRFMAEFKHPAMDACHGHWNYFSHCLSNNPRPWTPDSGCSESLIKFLNGAWGEGQNMVLKRAASTSTNGSGQQQVFAGIKKFLEKKSSIYIASLIFAIKIPKNDDNHFLIRTGRYT